MRMKRDWLTKKSPEISQILDAARRGICRYAGNCSLAVIIGNYDHGDVVISDRHNILVDHIEDLYRSLGGTRQPANIPRIFADHQYYSHNELTQAWFVKTTDEVRSGVLKEWLQAAADLTYITISSPKRLPLPRLGLQLENFGRTAVGEYLKKKGLSIDVDHILQQIARCSIATEEGSRATGQLAFVDRDRIGEISRSPKSHQVIVELSEAVPLTDYKHIVKTLQVTGATGFLAGTSAELRFLLRSQPADALIARFIKGKVEIEVNDEKVCRIINGEFFFPEHKLHEGPLNKLENVGIPSAPMERVRHILESCTTSRHGATIVISEQQPKSRLSGHQFKQTLSFGADDEYVQSMSAVDGAIWLDFAGNVLGFGYLLDGLISSTGPSDERRSRGSRYNSALRYSMRFPEATIVVISEDGPVTVLKNSSELYSDPLSEPFPFAGSGSSWGLLPSIQEWYQKGFYEDVDGFR